MSHLPHMNNTSLTKFAVLKITMANATFCMFLAPKAQQRPPPTSCLSNTPTCKH